MKIRYSVIIAVMLILVSCIPYDDDTCRMPMFGSKAYFTYSNLAGSKDKVHAVDIHLDATTGAELSDIVITASFPKEVRIGKAFSFTSNNSNFDTEGSLVKTENNVVSYIFSRSIKADKIICGIVMESLHNKWSKPIEVDISLNFKQIIQCSSGGMKDGRYTKKSTLSINPKDGKHYEREGRVEGEWVYVGQ